LTLNKRRRNPIVDKADVNAKTAVFSEQDLEASENATPARKKFVSPEISVPVDVLEATTFFQFASSGVTN
jgi:hypothetical protein